jgi:hypothetical protein
LLNPRRPRCLRRPSMCQCPIRYSRSLAQNSLYLYFQLLPAFAHAIVNVVLHSRTVNLKQLIEEFLCIPDDPDL